MSSTEALDETGAAKAGLLDFRVEPCTILGVRTILEGRNPMVSQIKQRNDSQAQLVLEISGYPQSKFFYVDIAKHVKFSHLGCGGSSWSHLILYTVNHTKEIMYTICLYIYIQNAIFNIYIHMYIYIYIVI